MHTKKILFILSQTPYINSLSQTALENIFAHASLECHCTIIFTDMGCEQLNANNESTQFKDIAKQLSALPLYDVENIFVLGEIKENFILKSALTPIDPSTMRQLIQNADMIYHY